MLRNEEFRSVLKKVIILQIIISILLFFMVNSLINRINSNIMKRDMSLVGNLINDYPELEEEIIPYITGKVFDEELELGQDVLESYGYTSEIQGDYQSIINNFNLSVGLIIGILSLTSSIPLLIILFFEYKKIYSKVSLASTAAERVVEGDFSIYLEEEAEGEFHILNHQFNQMSERLEHTLERLSNEKTFLSNMLSDISHQLKTPLSSLLIINDILMEDKDMDKSTKLEFLERNQTQLERMEWLIINLLKVARIQAGAIEFKREEVKIIDMLNISIKSLENQLKNQKLSIQGDLDATAYIDKNWTAEALINIIKNAAEHSRGSIHIIIEKSPIFLYIKIKDNGEGIDRENIPYVFDRFYKVSNEAKPQSIGIGLNLSKLIIDSQDGNITVESRKEQGTEFIVTFKSY